MCNESYLVLPVKVVTSEQVMLGMSSLVKYINLYVYAQLDTCVMFVKQKFMTW